jgi:hypothetical protein
MTLTSSAVTSLKNQPAKKRLGGWCEMAASLGPSQLSYQLTRMDARVRLWKENFICHIWSV